MGELWTNFVIVEGAVCCLAAAIALVCVLWAHLRGGWH